MRSLISSVDVAVLFLEVHRREKTDARPWAAPYATIVPRSRITAPFTGDSETAEFESPVAVPPGRESFSHEVFSCEPAPQKADPVFDLQTVDVFECRPSSAPEKADAALALVAVSVFECRPEEVDRKLDVSAVEIFASPPKPPRPCVIGDGDSVSLEPRQPAAPPQLPFATEEEEEEEQGGQGDWVLVQGDATLEEPPPVVQDEMDDSIPEVLGGPSVSGPQPLADAAAPISQPGDDIRQAPPLASATVSQPGALVVQARPSVSTSISQPAAVLMQTSPPPVAAPIFQPRALVPQAPLPALMSISQPAAVPMPPPFGSAPRGAATSIRQPAVITAQPPPSSPAPARQLAVAHTQLSQPPL
jgi:hypothetical protein